MDSTTKMKYFTGAVTRQRIPTEVISEIWRCLSVLPAEMP
jgi:hypothetical protein